MLIKRFTRAFKLRQPLRFRNPMQLPPNPLVESTRMLGATKRKGKYGAIRVNKFGLSFDSKAEFNRWVVLRGYQALDVISNLERQRTFIYGAGRRYIADFVYTMNGQKWIEDVKSPALLESFMDKARAVEAQYGIKVTPVHPKNVMLHPKIAHEQNVLTYFACSASKQNKTR